MTHSVRRNHRVIVSVLVAACVVAAYGFFVLRLARSGLSLSRHEIEPLLASHAFQESQESFDAIEHILKREDWPQRIANLIGRLSFDEAEIFVTYLTIIASITQNDIVLDLAIEFQSVYNNDLRGLDLNVAASLNTCGSLAFFQQLFLDSSETMERRRIGAIRTNSAAARPSLCEFRKAEMIQLAQSESAPDGLRVYAMHTSLTRAGKEEQLTLLKWIAEIELDYASLTELERTLLDEIRRE